MNADHLDKIILRQVGHRGEVGSNAVGGVRRSEVGEASRLAGRPVDLERAAC